MATDEDYPIDLPILVIEAQIFVAVKKFPFLPNKLIPTLQSTTAACLVVPATNLSLDWTAVMNFFHLLLNSIIWKCILCTLFYKPIMILGLEIYTFEDTGHGHTWAKDI